MTVLVMFVRVWWWRWLRDVYVYVYLCTRGVWRWLAGGGDVRGGGDPICSCYSVIVKAMDVLTNKDSFPNLFSTLLSQVLLLIVLHAIALIR